MCRAAALPPLRAQPEGRLGIHVAQLGQRACAANEYCKAHALHSNSQSWGGPRTWPGLWRRPFAAPGLSWHRHFEREPAWPPAGDVSFTVVREPIATAVAAYLEISRRPDGLAETAKSAYRSMARNNCSAPNARFEAFLDDIERRSEEPWQSGLPRKRPGGRSLQKRRVSPL